MSELTPRTIGKIMLAEGLGTAILAAAATALFSFSSGFDVSATTILPAVAVGFVVMVLVHAFGPFSGANLNPAVSVALTVYRKLPLMQLPVYLISQILGALAGVSVMRFLFDVPMNSVTLYETTQQMAVAEFVGTLILVFVIMLAVLGRIKAEHAAFAIGFALATGLFIATTISGASLNPAIALGALTFEGAWWGAYLLPLVGGVAGASLAVIIHELAAAE